MAGARTAPGAWVGLLLGLLLGGAGCLTIEETPARTRSEYDSFGQELFAVWADELGRSEPPALAPDRVEALLRRAPQVQQALDQMTVGPVGQPDGLLPLLASPTVLARWDDGTMAGLFQDLAALLARLEQGDRLALHGLAAWLEAPGGHNPDGPWRLAARLLQLPLPLISELGRLVEVHRPALDALHDRLGAELRRVAQDGATGAEATTGDDDDTARRWRSIVEDLLLADGCGSLTDADGEGGEAATPGPAGSPDCGGPAYPVGSLQACRCELAALHGYGATLTVRTDAAGNPRVARDADGRLRGPFFDGDGDGEPDRGADGRTLRADGTPFTLAALANPVSSQGEEQGEDSAEVLRDAQGRAIEPASGLPLYEYVELKESLLGLALALARDWVEPGEGAAAAQPVPLEDLLDTLPALLGPERQGPEGPWHDAEVGPLVGLLHAGVELLHYPRLPELLEALARVARSRPDALERVWRELGRAATLLAEAPEVLAPGSNLVDDLLGDNPFLALGPGRACDPDSAGAACFASSWLACDRTSRTCQPRPDPGAGEGPPGLLELLSDEPGLLRELLRLAATDPAVAQLAASSACMVSKTGVDVEALPLDDGLCPLADYSRTGGVLPSTLLRACWREDLDRSLPDDSAIAAPAARSAFQDVLALIYDTSRLTFDPTLVTAEQTMVLPILNVAAFYLDSAADRSQVDSVALSATVLRPPVGHLLCELGLEDADDDVLTPTASQLDLWILRNHDGTGNPVQDVGNVIDHEGVQSRWHYADTLVALGARCVRPDDPLDCDEQATLPFEEWEQRTDPPLLDGLRPIVRLFAAHGLAPGSARRGMSDPSSGGTQLLLDLFSTLHIHWGSSPRCNGLPLQGEPGGFADLPGGGCPYGRDGLYGFDRQEGSGLRRVEPWLARIVRETDLFPAVFSLLAAGEAQGLNDELAPLLRWLLDREAYGRGEWDFVDGRGAGVLRGDRQQRERRPSRLYLLLEPLRQARQALDEPGREQARAAWERLDLVRLLWGAAGQDGRSRSLAGLHLLREALVLAPDLLRRAKDAGGGVGPGADGHPAWLGELGETADEAAAALASPWIWQLFDLWRELREDVEARQWGLQLAGTLLDDPGPPELDCRGPLLETLAQLGRLRPASGSSGQLARGMGELFDPQQRPVLGVVQAGARLAATDPRGLFTLLAGNLLAEDRSFSQSRRPLTTLLGALTATLRLDPGAEEPLRADDLRWFVDRTRAFLLDEEHGVGRVVQLVRGR